MNDLVALAMKYFKCLLFYIISFCAAFNSSTVRAERSCREVVAELDRVLFPLVACARKVCPDFRLTYTGSDIDDKCGAGCNGVDAGRITATETELDRCKASFKDPDDQDFFRIAKCVAASRGIGEVVLGYSMCSRRGKCLMADPWHSKECMEQCQSETKILLEQSTKTIELCAGLGQSHKGVCTMVQSIIDKCYDSNNCGRLEKVLERNCPEVKGGGIYRK